MQMIPVASSNIRAIGYDDATSTMVVAFHGNTCYEYDHVPRRVFEAFLHAGSKGTFHADYIKEKYSFRKI